MIAPRTKTKQAPSRRGLPYTRVRWTTVDNIDGLEPARPPTGHGGDVASAIVRLMQRLDRHDAGVLISQPPRWGRCHAARCVRDSWGVRVEGLTTYDEPETEPDDLHDWETRVEEVVLDDAAPAVLLPALRKALPAMRGFRWPLPPGMILARAVPLS